MEIGLSIIRLAMWTGTGPFLLCVSANALSEIVSKEDDNTAELAKIQSQLNLTRQGKGFRGIETGESPVHGFLGTWSILSDVIDKFGLNYDS